MTNNRHSSTSVAVALLGVLVIVGRTPAQPGLPAPPPAENKPPFDAGAAPGLESGAAFAEAQGGPSALQAAPAAADAPGPTVWGVIGLRGYGLGDKIAPNGVEFRPIFMTELNLNLWLWRGQGLYVFTDTLFWAQKAAPGITNPSQGAFDFSKREFDLQAGPAWNFYGRWEARAFAYSFNNLNRGASRVAPAGFNDGVGLEARRYISDVYDTLGTAAFDVARAPFLSVGYYPTKDMVDGAGVDFKPGPFARAYLTWDLWGDRCYLFGDATLIGLRSFQAKMLNLDAGAAFRPLPSAARWEFRLGVQSSWDLQRSESDQRLYGAVRLVY